MDKTELKSAVEAILFASGDPISIKRIADVFNVENITIEETAEHLRDEYKARGSGICIIRIEDKLQMCSSQKYADCVRLALETRKPPQLTQPAAEVLSIIAYFQPVTKAYIEQVRGVDSSYTIGLLQDRGLIESSGRLAVPGRPLLYKTTDAFLRTFGISSLEELPPLPEAEQDTDEQRNLENAIAALQTEPENDR